MSEDQIIILAILVAAMGLFVWGPWRHDVVAMAALLASVAAGIVPPDQAFLGFGHPAVVTVACVLVLSNALQETGAVDALTRIVLPRKAGPVAATSALASLSAVLSGFMNNVGALALLMPLCAETAARHGVPPGRVLMPVAFASILGGMTTLIGTPPNLIVSAFREKAGEGAFAMFDFTPVGLAVAASGLGFILLVGWRLVPARKRLGGEGFEIGKYLTEVRVIDGGKAAGMILNEIEAALGEIEAQVIALVRKEKRILTPSPFREVHSGDILVIEADPGALTKALAGLGLELEGAGSLEGEETLASPALASAKKEAGDLVQSKDVVLMELAVRTRAEIIGRSARDIRLRTRHGINLLAISREGRRSTERLRSTGILEGDLLLVQGAIDAIQEFANRFGCIPLATRTLNIPEPRKALLAAAVMVLAIATAAFGVAPASVSFAAGVGAIVLLKVTPARSLYNSIDWPVIVLLGALIPIAGAISSTGAADLVAKAILHQLAGGNAVLSLALILVVTMMLSDFMNNAATAAVMCPIAFGVASQLGVNVDAFLMAVAVGASCAFLTPIGHQNNMLILGPGGFRFGDYWQLGFPLEVVIVVVALPMLLWTWPL